MKTYDASATLDALPFERLVPALKRMFIDGCEVPARQVHTLGSGLTTLVMPAWQGGRYLGIKIVNVAPANAARGLPGLHSTYLLYDATTGVPLASIDGNEITSRRTAAASALAAAKLARHDARRLLVVGAGRVGRLIAEAYRAVLPIEQVTLWSRTKESAHEALQYLVARGIAVTVADDLAAAVRRADIVSCSTLATEPLVRGEWLAPGSHLDLIGSFTPAMREADDACFVGAGLWVDTEEALAKSGDLLGPIARGVFAASDLRGTLAQLCRAECPARRDANERTVFKSVGTALEDLAAAILVHEART